MEPHDNHTPTGRAPVQITAGSITATFTWAGDRWGHLITPLEAGEAAGWESCDAPWSPANDPRWPSSPVLVELSRVEVPQAGAAGTPAIVGVGLAGRSHFSASIAPDPHAANALRFEIACRLHEPPVWLGSTYRAGGGRIQLTAIDGATVLPRTVVWSYSIGPQGLFAVSGATVSTVPT
jgi:hypothetical protein